MTKNAYNTYFEQSVEELKVAYTDLSRTLFRLRNELRTTYKLEKPHKMKEARRNRARVLTALRAKQGTLN